MHVWVQGEGLCIYCPRVVHDRTCQLRQHTLLALIMYENVGGSECVLWWLFMSLFKQYANKVIHNNSFNEADEPMDTCTGTLEPW